MVNFNLRLEKDLKEKTGAIFENYGMTTAQAIRMFLHNVANTKKIPLVFDYQANDRTPSPSTLEAIEEVKNGDVIKYKNLDEFVSAFNERT